VQLRGTVDAWVAQGGTQHAGPFDVGTSPTVFPPASAACPVWTHSGAAWPPVCVVSQGPPHGTGVTLDLAFGDGPLASTPTLTPPFPLLTGKPAHGALGGQGAAASDMPAVATHATRRPRMALKSHACGSLLSEPMAASETPHTAAGPAAAPPAGADLSGSTAGANHAAQEVATGVSDIAALAGKQHPSCRTAPDRVTLFAKAIVALARSLHACAQCAQA
jgi:hypothetical protein